MENQEKKWLFKAIQGRPLLQAVKRETTVQRGASSQV
jgi:hypothetical protein